MVYRFLLTRRWLGLLAVTILVAAGCVVMGRWQVERLDQRHERNGLLDRNLTAAPVAVDRLLRPGREPAAGKEFRRVRAVGHYDLNAQLLVRLRPYAGQVGFYVLTPLVTGSGAALLVNRGWVPRAATATETPAVAPPPTGRVAVVARLRPTEPPSTTGTPPPGQVSRIDTAAIARRLPYPVYGGYGELTDQRPSTTTTSPTSLPVPVPLPAPEPTEGPHLAYAFQWFLFAGLALGGYLLLARREALDRRAAVAGPVPPARVGAASWQR